MFFFINGIFCCDCDNSKEKKCGISNEWEQKSCYETHKSYLDAHRRAVHTHKRQINNVCFVYEEKTFNMMTSSAAFSLAWATFSIWNISISMSEREHMCVYCVVLWEAWKWQNFLVHKMYLFPALVRMTMGSERYSFVVSRLFAYDKRNWIFQMYFSVFLYEKKAFEAFTARASCINIFVFFEISDFRHLHSKWNSSNNEYETRKTIIENYLRSFGLKKKSRGDIEFNFACFSPFWGKKVTSFTSFAWLHNFIWFSFVRRYDVFHNVVCSRFVIITSFQSHEITKKMIRLYVSATLQTIFNTFFKKIMFLYDVDVLYLYSCDA